MKDYLVEPLTEEEKDEIIGIIKVTARSFKYKLFRNKYIDPLFLDDLEIVYYDKYLFDSYGFKDYKGYMRPITEEEKTDIVNKLNNLMDDLRMFDLKRALTFNEKLVFFFTYMYREQYLLKEVAIYLDTTERTIYNRRETLKTKIECIKEAMLWVKILIIIV